MTFASLNRSHNAWMVGDGARVKRNEESPRVMHMTRQHSGPSIIHYSGAASSVLFPVGHDEIPAIVAYSRDPYELRIQESVGTLRSLRSCSHLDPTWLDSSPIAAHLPPDNLVERGCALLTTSLHVRVG